MTVISPSSPISTSLLAEALIVRDNFSFSRWGDGEWKALLHPGAGHNCDGHDYFPSLGAALAEVLESHPRYLLGMQSFAQKRMGDEINTWLAQRKLTDLVWCDSDILHRSSIKDELGAFMGALRQRRNVLVGPARLQPIAAALKAELVEIPLYNAWESYAPTHSQIVRHLEEDTVVLYCAGMTSNVHIDHLWGEYADWVTQIDIGSLFDPFCGIASRSYHQAIIDRSQPKP